MAEDIETIEGIDEEAAESSQPGKLSQLASTSLNSIRGGWKKAASGAATLINKVKNEKLKEEEQSPLFSYDEKIETVRKLKQLVDEGILSQEEFEAKKKEILGL